MSYGLHVNRTYTPGTETDYWSLASSVEWKPTTRLSLQVGPELQRVIENAQYVATVPAPGEVPADLGGAPVVMARLEQTTVAAAIRLNVSFTTDLTLQTYLQPLISAGAYSDFKELARAGSYEFVRYGAARDAETGLVTPPGGTPFVLGDPSFNFRSLRGNAVLRWEYRPGSVLYFVWTQQRTDAERFGELRLGPSSCRLFDAQADDVFMVKATYPIGL